LPQLPLWLAALGLKFLGGRGKNRMMISGLETPGIGHLDNGTSAQDTKITQEFICFDPANDMFAGFGVAFLGRSQSIRVLLFDADT